MQYNESMTTHNLVTLSNTAVTLLSPANVHSGTDITVQSVNTSGYVYVGGSDVSSTNYGYRLLPNHAISFELSGRDSIYAITSAPDMKVAVIQIALESGE